MAISRHELRIKAFELIFQSNVISAEEALDIARIEEPEYFKKTYVETVVAGAAAKKVIIDALIKEHLRENWSLERLSKVVYAVLKLAVFEIFYLEDVPAGAAINEAVEIVKQYGDEKEPAFVNGILAAILRDGNDDIRN